MIFWQLIGRIFRSNASIFNIRPTKKREQFFHNVQRNVQTFFDNVQGNVQTYIDNVQRNVQNSLAMGKCSHYGIIKF